MAKEQKDAKDVGNQSPASESAKRDPAHEHEASVRKGYDAAQKPEKQGDGDPGLDELKDGPSVQDHGAGGGQEPA